MITPRYPKSPLARAAVFLLLAAIAFFASGATVGLMGISGPQGSLWFSATFSIGLLAATLLCARPAGERLSDLGFRASRRDLAMMLLAFLVGALAFGGALLVLGQASGGTWQLNGGTPVRAALAGLVPVLCLLLGEELLFRGYAFQHLKRVVGPAMAVVLSAALFGGYHLLGSGDWAMGAFFRFLMPTLGGLVFGYALVRTGSLAVPIGLHWGGNWMQSAVLGLGHAPSSDAILIMPLSAEQVRILSAPDVLPHLPYLVALGMMTLLVWVLPIRSRPLITNR